MNNNRTRNTIMVIVIALLLMVNLSLGILLTKQSSQAMITLLQNRMLDISNTAADMIDGDSLASLCAEDEGSEEYQAVIDTLTYFQDNIDPPVVYTDALYQASLGTPAVDDTPYEDAWGTFYSAYSPVFTSDGKVGGIIARPFPLLSLI